MKKYLIKVDMKDVWEYAATWDKAYEIAMDLRKQHPDTKVGVYRLASVFI